MPELVYTPGVEVYIQTEKNGILDVSDDVAYFVLERRSDGVSSFNFTLTNASRKYDGVFTPNDRIFVNMKRVAKVKVFTGYLNSVPLVSVWPKSVDITASCTLKRLQYWYWDPTANDTIAMAAAALREGSSGDGSAVNLILTILEKVTGWDRKKIHISKIPDHWFKIADKLAEVVEKDSAVNDAVVKAYLEKLGGSGSVAGGGGGSVANSLSGSIGGFKGDQLRNAEAIYSVGIKKGATRRDQIVALMTAMQESMLKNINYGDRDSVGLFQQRTSQGWGTVKQIMDPEYAAGKFFDALLKVSGRNSMPLWKAAQTVQRSGFPMAYAKWESPATKMVDIMEKASKSSSSITGTLGSNRASNAAGSMSNKQFCQVGLDFISKYPNIPYTQKYGGTQMKVLSANPPPGLDCSSFLQAVVLRARGSLYGCPRVANDQYAYCVKNAKAISVSDAMKTPGAILFRGPSKRGIDHIEISLGDGQRAFGAHRSGTNASIGGKYGAGYWQYAALLPGINYTIGGGTSGLSIGGRGAPWVKPVNAKEGTPFGKKGSMWSSGQHTGLDYPAPTGTKVVAVAAGRVIYAAESGPYGKHIKIQHPGSLQSLYAHLSSISISDGDNVKAGQKIGEVGSTGNSSGPHLHLEARENGVPVDPKPYLDGTKDTGSGQLAGTEEGNKADFVKPIPYKESEQYNAASGFDKIFGDAPFFGLPPDSQNQDFILSNTLMGLKTLLNDTPLLDYIKRLMAGIMRSFCSAPNGDFIAWFPDYYGHWGTAAKMEIEPIELMDFTVYQSDEQFVTHQYVSTTPNSSMATNAISLATGSVSSLVTGGDMQLVAMQNVAYTRGIASIDIPSVLYATLGIEATAEEGKAFSQYITQKYGARPNHVAIPTLSGPSAQFFAALYYFMRQWGYQFNADVPMTFMPELWPGMLLQIPKFGFQAYVTTVRHTGRFGPNGGFTTRANIAAPAKMQSGKYVDNLVGLPAASDAFKKRLAELEKSRGVEK